MATQIKVAVVGCDDQEVRGLIWFLGTGLAPSFTEHLDEVEIEEVVRGKYKFLLERRTSVKEAGFDYLLVVESPQHQGFQPLDLPHLRLWLDPTPEDPKIAPSGVKQIPFYWCDTDWVLIMRELERVTKGPKTRCERTTRKGEVCKNNTVSGFLFCNVHLKQVLKDANKPLCAGVNPAGISCNNPAQPNSAFCKRHTLKPPRELCHHLNTKGFNEGSRCNRYVVRDSGFCSHHSR